MRWRFWSRNHDDLDHAREFRAHLEHEIEENLARGMPLEDARHAANLKFGNRTRIREDVYEKHGAGFVETLFRDARYATRTFARSPGFTVAAIVCLALGIGATTAIYSVVQAVLLRPLAYREPARLVRMYTEFPQGGQQRFWMSPHEYLELARDLRSWQALEAWSTSGVNVAGDTDPIRVNTAFVTGGLFSMLGVSPQLGRAIAPSDDVPGAAPVVVLSHALWQRVFAGDANAVGRSVRVNGQNATILGVMPPAFSFPPGDLEPAEAWIPIKLGPPNPRQRAAHFLSVAGRLGDGVSLAQAEAEIATQVRDAAAAGSAAGHALSPEKHPVVLHPMHEEVVRGVQRALWILLGAAIFVLLIACVNVANLLLARAEWRQREIAIRRAIGAGTTQLVRQFTIEGLLLSGAGALSGVGLAAWGLRWMVASGAASIPRAAEVAIDPAVLAFTLGISFLTAMAFGLAPLATAGGGTLHARLKSAAGRGVGAAMSNRFRSLLVSGELALALMLLIGAGLMLRAFRNLTEVDPGFRADNLLTLRINLPPGLYPRPANIRDFWTRAQEKVAAVPGVLSATAMSGLPPERALNAYDTEFEGYQPVSGGTATTSDFYQDVGYRFFETMGARLIEGRFFDARDNEAGAPTIIVNQSLARAYYGSASPLGRRIRPEGTDPYRTIVGVVADLKNAALDKPAGTEVFIPFRQPYAEQLSRAIYLAVRTSVTPQAAVADVRAAIRGLDPSLPLSQVRAMEEVVDNARSHRRFLMTLLGLFSAASLLLAAVGLYGVISYTVARRTGEFGIRIALGARPGAVLWLVVADGLKMAAMGVGLGVAGALSLARLIRGLLFGVSAFDPLTFAGMAALLIAVTLVACAIPARRAVRVDPLVALRQD